MVGQKTDDYQEKLPTSQRTKCQRRRRCSFTIHVSSQTSRIFTHFPKDPTIEICNIDEHRQSTVQTRAMPELFEHTAQSSDHKPQNKQGGATPQHRYAAVVQGVFTNWQNRNRTRHKKKSCRKKPTLVHRTHDMSTPYRPKKSGNYHRSRPQSQRRHICFDGTVRSL